MADRPQGLGTDFEAGTTMIKDWPTHLLNQADYKKLPEKAFAVNSTTCLSSCARAWSRWGAFPSANTILRPTTMQGRVQMLHCVPVRFRRRTYQVYDYDF